MNKTAVEWLYESLILNESNPAYNNWVLDKAKIMEKEEMLKAINFTIENEYTEQTWANCKSVSDQAEQYYNQIFTHE